MKKTALLLLLLASQATAQTAPPAVHSSPRAREAAKDSPPAATSPAPPTETLTYGRFGKVYIYRNKPHPRHVALFFSGDGGWNLGVVDMAKILADQDTLVVGISVPYYVAKLNAAKESCTSAAVDLELLSKYVQKTLGLPDYEPPVLVGYSSGATLAYAALVQAPPSTFKGAISMGFCPDLNLVHPFCPGHGIASDPDPNPKVKGIIFRPASTLEQPWIAFQGTIDQVCAKDDVVKYTARVKGSELVLLPDVGHGFSKTYKWAPQFRQAFRKIVGGDQPVKPATAPANAAKGIPLVNDLPLVEVPAKGPGKALAVMISGDGGWAGIDKDVSQALAAKGIPVVGWNSLQYFWTARKPDAAARDLERILRRYLAVWGKQEVLLIGYSFGADVLPFFASRLPADLLGAGTPGGAARTQRDRHLRVPRHRLAGRREQGATGAPRGEEALRTPARPLPLRQQGEGQHLPASPRHRRQGAGAARRPPLRRGLRRSRRADPQGGAAMSRFLSHP